MGLPVPAHVRDQLASALARGGDDLGSLRHSDPDGWHVTLAFVGELADERVPALRTTMAEAVAGADLPPLELTLDGAGRFAGRVLFAAVVDHPTGTLARLGTTLQTAIEQAGLPVARQQLHPHVTLARGGRSVAVSAERVAALQALLPTQPPVRWSPEAIALYRAIDRDGPARYVVEASVPLSG